jgi:hypothetical protein
MADLKERMTLAETVQYLNLCEAYVCYLIHTGDLSWKRDERDARYLRGEDLVAYQEACRAQWAAMATSASEPSSSRVSVAPATPGQSQQLGLLDDAPAPRRDVLAEIRASRDRAPLLDGVRKAL